MTGATSFQGLTSEQQGFVLSAGPAPGDMGAVNNFCRAFQGMFGFTPPPPYMVQILSVAKRKRKRSGAAANKSNGGVRKKRCDCKRSIIPGCRR